MSALAARTQKPFKLTAKQEEALDLFAGLALYILLYGGSRSTKTFTIVRTIVIRALAVPGSRHLIARFRFNHVKTSIIHDTFPKVMDLCFPGCPYKLDKSDWFIEFPNGSQIWFGGLDDKERTEKILGNEYATIFLNECSQISYSSYLMLVTRLAQVCNYVRDGERRELRLKMFLDENPPTRGHWTHKLFIEGKDPGSRRPVDNPEDYAALLMNPVDNAENLPKTYMKALQNLPKRQRDRFWLGKFADDSEQALWNTEIIDSNRVTDEQVPEIVRYVVAVDPSGADDDETKNNDDIGLGVAGLGVDGKAYVFKDATLNASPSKWGKAAAQLYADYGADRVVGEDNFGGAMVEFVVKTANPNISYKAVKASRGKVVRAEPVSALHESGRIKFVGRFDDLEDELLAFTTTGYTGEKSPNRADWFVWAITELLPDAVWGARPDTPPEPKHIPDYAFGSETEDDWKVV